MTGPRQEGAGISLLVALRDHAIAEAEDREQEAASLEAKARALRWEAQGLRETHAKAAPYFPAELKMVKDLGPTRSVG